MGEYEEVWGWCKVIEFEGIVFGVEVASVDLDGGGVGVRSNQLISNAGYLFFV